jgi:hypothetical protein
MANERINQIPTTATSFASDDYLPIDGTTNGTRKILGSPIPLKDSNGNLTVNCLFEGYVNQAASGTTITLTAASAQNYCITGSGGQVIKLPDATTLPNGALFSFNNNQSSGTITVQNNSGTTVCTTQSGAYIYLVLLSNSTAAGSWDYHNVLPSNASWSTNTLNWAGAANFQTGNYSNLLYVGGNAAGRGSSCIQAGNGIQAVSPSITGQVDIGSVSYNFYNSGVGSNFSGSFLRYTDTSTTGNFGSSSLPLANLGQIIFQNTSNGLISTNGSNSLYLGSNSTYNVVINSVSTTSSSTTTGALTVNGGVGITGALYTGGLIYNTSGLYYGSGSSCANYWIPTSGTNVFQINQTIGSSFIWYGSRAATSDNQAMTLTPSGGLYLNTYAISGVQVTQQTAGGYAFAANAINNGGNYYYALFNAGGSTTGSITSNGTTTTYNTLSDKRLKSSLNPWSLGDKFDELSINQFTWKKSGITGYGVLAQDLYKIYPDAVTKGDDLPELDQSKQGAAWCVDYGKLTIPLIAEVQALRKRVAKLEAA